jgi:GAF domain
VKIMEDSQTWRALLGKIIANPQERQRIAEVMGVKSITLTRWSTQKSKPRLDNLRPLLDAVPQYREDLKVLLGEDYPELLRDPQETKPLLAEIPSAFYGRILNTSTTSPPILRKATICTLILQQMLSHLDPRQYGMAVLIILCVPPCPKQNVRSLRINFGRGNPPWESHLEHHIGFLGAESQVGHAVRTGHPIIIQSQNERNWLYSAHIFDFEESVVATPLLLGDQTAGCLYVASTRQQYFSQMHLDLIQAYVDLLVVAFEADDFYFFQQIELELMPLYSVQQHYLLQFHQQVVQRMIQSTHEQKPLTRQSAEIEVWQALESELLYLALHPQPVGLPVSG